MLYIIRLEMLYPKVAVLERGRHGLNVVVISTFETTLNKKQLISYFLLSLQTKWLMLSK